MKYIFCGDRQISVNIQNFLISQGYPPTLLIVVDTKNSTHSTELIENSGLSSDKVIYSSQLNEESSINIIRQSAPDYIIGIHFPEIISNEILGIPKIGFLNLHPAYLPYNKGWHTPTWAIIDNTPYGATLHFMSEKLDGGDIIKQARVDVLQNDTADTLYAKVLKLEEELFVKTFMDLISLNPLRIPQTEKGTSHNKKDIETIRELKLNEEYKVSVLIDRLRALTTNNINEAAYFVKDGSKYLIQIRIEKQMP